jgi:hypothetical protein
MLLLVLLVFLSLTARNLLYTPFTASIGMPLYNIVFYRTVKIAAALQFAAALLCTFSIVAIASFF